MPSSTVALITLIKKWMKSHPNEYLPTFKEVIKGSLYQFYTIPSYSECKLEAFRQLEIDGYILKTAHIDRSFKAKIIGTNPAKANQVTCTIVSDGIILFANNGKKIKVRIARKYLDQLFEKLQEDAV